jgi:hypothetical protein
MRPADAIVQLNTVPCYATQCYGTVLWPGASCTLVTQSMRGAGGAAALQGTRSCAEVKTKLDVLVAQRGEAGGEDEKLELGTAAAAQAKKNQRGRKKAQKRNGNATVRWMAQNGADKVRGLSSSSYTQA